MCELKNGHYKSCGCLHSFDFDRDYKNKMFHNIEVLELINEENADAVVNTLVEKVANSDAAKKAQENVTNSKNWLKDNQDTIEAINLLLETLKN